MSEYTEYITKEGDRWDLIAYQHYGNANLYEQIIVANPQIVITPTLKSGIRLKIPTLEENQQIKFELPPWKR